MMMMMMNPLSMPDWLTGSDDDEEDDDDLFDQAFASALEEADDIDAPMHHQPS